MNTLGSSKVHEKEVYSLWVILDHTVESTGGVPVCLRQFEIVRNCSRQVTTRADRPSKNGNVEVASLSDYWCIF